MDTTTGYIVLYRDKKSGIKLTMSNDCRVFTFIEYPQNLAKTLTIEDLTSAIKELNIAHISLDKLRQTNPLLGKNLEQGRDYGDNDDHKRKYQKSLYRTPKNSQK